MGRIIIELLSPKGKAIESRHIFDKDKVSLGRSYSNDLILDDEYVSPEHILISFDDGIIQLQDLSSENGILVNNIPENESGTVEVKSGDIISLGTTRLKIFSPEHPVEPARILNKPSDAQLAIDKPIFPFLSYFMFLGAVAWFGYMKLPGEIFWEKKIVSIVLGSIVMSLGASGAFSLYTFYKYKKSFFARNLVIINIGMTLIAIFDKLQPFLFFWALNPNLTRIMDLTFGFIFMLAILYVCMKFVKESMEWRDLMHLGWVPLIIVLMVALRSDEFRLGFHSKPVFHKTMAPGLSPLIEPLNIDEFLKEGALEFEKLPKD